MFWPQRWFLADELALVPRLSPRRCGRGLRLHLHGHPPGLVRRDQDAGPGTCNEQAMSAFDVLPPCSCQKPEPAGTQLRNFGELILKASLPSVTPSDPLAAAGVDDCFAADRSGCTRKVMCLGIFAPAPRNPLSFRLWHRAYDLWYHWIRRVPWGRAEPSTNSIQQARSGGLDITLKQSPVMSELAQFAQE